MPPAAYLQEVPQVVDIPLATTGAIIQSRQLYIQGFGECRALQNGLVEWHKKRFELKDKK